MAKTIVILGAGISAITILRQIMKNIVLPSADYKVVLVAPNTHFHWPLAMPRVLVPGQIPVEKVLVSLKERLGEYPSDKYEHVLGNANNLNPNEKNVQVELSSGGSRLLQYDYLVIATGASARDGMPWKVAESVEKTREAIARVHGDVKRAQTIVVAGGGPTAAETAGELGFEYSKSGAKEVYFVYSGEYPLPSNLIDSVRKQAASTLGDLKVKLVPNSTITKTTQNESGDTVLELTSKDGKVESLTAQAYIPAFGLAPNSSFMPQSFLDKNGFIKQTRKLQVEGHTDIFVAGDVGALEECRATTAGSQGEHVAKALQEVIKGKGEAPEYAYKPDAANTIAVTLGRSKATGQLGTWKLPSVLIWFAKGRTLFTEKVDALFA